MTVLRSEAVRSSFSRQRRDGSFVRSGAWFSWTRVNYIAADIHNISQLIFTQYSHYIAAHENISQYHNITISIPTMVVNDVFQLHQHSPRSINSTQHQLHAFSTQHQLHAPSYIISKSMYIISTLSLWQIAFQAIDPRSTPGRRSFNAVLQTWW